MNLRHYYSRSSILKSKFTNEPKNSTTYRPPLPEMTAMRETKSLFSRLTTARRRHKSLDWDSTFRKSSLTDSHLGNSQGFVSTESIQVQPEASISFDQPQFQKLQATNQKKIKVMETKFAKLDKAYKNLKREPESFSAVNVSVHDGASVTTIQSEDSIYATRQLQNYKLPNASCWNITTIKNKTDKNCHNTTSQSIEAPTSAIKTGKCSSMKITENSNTNHQSINNKILPPVFAPHNQQPLVSSLSRLKSLDNMSKNSNNNKNKTNTTQQQQPLQLSSFKSRNTQIARRLASFNSLDGSDFTNVTRIELSSRMTQNTRGRLGSGRKMKNDFHSSLNTMKSLNSLLPDSMIQVGDKTEEFPVPGPVRLPHPVASAQDVGILPDGLPNRLKSDQTGSTVNTKPSIFTYKPKDYNDRCSQKRESEN